MTADTLTGPQTIADLNERNDPTDLSHYFLPERVEGAFLDGGRPVALCGFRLSRRPDVADVTSTSKGEYVPDDVQLCPTCHVLNKYRWAGGSR